MPKLPLLLVVNEEYHAQRMNKQFEGLCPQVLPLPEAYPWKGNIRELKNLIKRAVFLASGSPNSRPNYSQ